MTVINKMENYTYISEIFGSGGLAAKRDFNEYVQKHPDYEFVSMCPVGLVVLAVFRYKTQKGKRINDNKIHHETGQATLAVDNKN